MDKITVSHEELKKLSYELADKIIRSGFQPQLVVLLMKGGLHSGYYVVDKLSHHRNTKIPIDTINIASYKNDNIQGEIKLYDLFTKDFSSYKTLIIDDLVDTGKTLLCLLENSFPEKILLNKIQVKTATLFLKETPENKYHPDFYVKKIAGDSPKDIRIDFDYENNYDR